MKKGQAVAITQLAPFFFQEEVVFYGISGNKGDSCRHLYG